jgi:hypothetical protein
MYVAVDGAGLQQPNAKIGLREIMHWYQHLICANEPASDASPCKHWTLQIWPHFAAFVLPLTVAVDCDCNPVHPSRQGDAFSGWMACAVKNVM